MKRLMLCLALSLPVAAFAADSGSISVTDAWSRVTAGTSVPGVAYLTITDTGAADALTSISSPIAGEAALHQSRTENGVTSMSPVKSLPIAAGGTVTLAPGGYHIMLEGLKQPLKAGDQFPLTLVFAHAGPITTMVMVKAMGSATPKDDGMGSMKMDHM